MLEEFVDFLRGGSMVALLGIGLFFWRFHKETGDRFFAFLSGSFFLLAIGQTLVLVGGTSDYTPLAYWLRLSAFIFIIVAIVQKNLPKES